MIHINKEMLIPGEYKLSGTITIPKDAAPKFPAVLILAGSGDGDRDGNMKKINTNIYKELSDKLTAHGYITLRYDKRGVGQSEGDYFKAGISDFLVDAVRAIRFLKTIKEVDQERIFLLGHSEGALLAPAAYVQEKVHGVILLCGVASPGKELLPLQSDALSREIQQMTGFKRMLFNLLKVEKQFNKVFNKAIASDKAVIRYLGVKKINAKWLREIYAFDVREYLKKVDCQVLVISGEKDIQADPNDAIKIAKLIPGPTKSMIISNMNHLLRKYEGKHHLLTLMKEYKKSVKQNLSNDLIQELYRWLDDNTGTIKAARAEAVTKEGS